MTKETILLVLEFAKVISPILAAATAAWVTHKFGKIQAAIATQQASTASLAAKTAHNKLKLDLLDRRLTVYEALKKALSESSRTGKFDREAQDFFLAAKAKSPWLFGAEIKGNVEKIYTDLKDLNESYGYINIQSPKQEYNQQRWEDAKIITKDHLNNLDNLFSKYLRLEE